MSLHIISIPLRKRNLYLPSIASSSSQKTITASLLSRWSNDISTKDVEDLIINSWVENTRKQYRTYFGQQKELVKITILVRQMHASQKAQNSYLRFTRKD